MMYLCRVHTPTKFSAAFMAWTPHKISLSTTSQASACCMRVLNYGKLPHGTSNQLRLHINDIPSTALKFADSISHGLPEHFLYVRLSQVEISNPKQHQILQSQSNCCAQRPPLLIQMVPFFCLACLKQNSNLSSGP